jgi:ABC-type molybdate transport system substrate-binding protein
MISSHHRSYGLYSLMAGSLALCLVFSGGTAMAAAIEVFHADSLAGPMKALKGAFETRNPGAQVNLTTGRSQELAERILKGDICDVFTPSAPAVIEKDLMTKKVAETDRTGASWSVIFSANEMVIITTKGNPLGIKKMRDLANAGVRFTRVTGEKDMATQRTIDFVKNVTALEGNPQLGQGIIAGAVTDPAKPHTVPETIRDIATGKADAGVVYYSAAVEAKNDVDSLRFPAEVNLSSQIRNAATVPSTAKEPTTALAFVRFILSDEGRKILEATGQPPIVPPLTKGEIPQELK